MPDDSVVQTDIVKKPHVYERGEYREVIYDPSKNPYPKVMYHRDYVHNKVEGQEYPQTARPITVESQEEEEALGEDWKPSPADHGIQTAPDAAEIQKRKLEKAAKAADWKTKINAPSAEITERHVEFLQSVGRTDVDDVPKACNLLSTFNSQQMSSFLADFNKWNDKRLKKLAKAKEAKGKE